MHITDVIWKDIVRTLLNTFYGYYGQHVLRTLINTDHGRYLEGPFTDLIKYVLRMLLIQTRYGPS